MKKLNNLAALFGLNLVLSALVPYPLYAAPEEFSFLIERPYIEQFESISQATSVDLGDDGQVEHFFMSSWGILYAVDSGGHNLPNYPISITNLLGNPMIGYQTRQYAPTISDLNGDGTYEIVVAFSWLDDEFIYRTRLLIIGENGIMLPGSPMYITVTSEITAEDLDNDGNKELIFTSGGECLEIRKLSGEPFNNLFPACSDLQFGEEQTFSVGDISGDGRKDIILGARVLTGYRVAVYDPFQAGTVPGFPRLLPGFRPPNPAPIFSSKPSTAVGDINADGQLDVIAYGRDPQDNLKLAAYNSNGQYLPGWPVVIQSGYYGPSPLVSLGDLDLDGNLEIIVGTIIPISSGVYKHQVFVYQSNGQLAFGWPQEIYDANGGITEISIADLNGDDQKEIVVFANHNVDPPNLENWVDLLVWDRHGKLDYEMSQRFSIDPSIQRIGTIQTPTIVHSVAALDKTRKLSINSKLFNKIGDLDANILFPFEIQSFDNLGRRFSAFGLFMLDHLEGTPTNLNPACDWSQFRGSAEHTGAIGLSC